MTEQRTNVIAKSNANILTLTKGTICRSDVLRLIYERKDRFSEKVRLCDIDDILETLKLKKSEAQTVESGCFSIFNYSIDLKKNCNFKFSNNIYF